MNAYAPALRSSWALSSSTLLTSAKFLNGLASSSFCRLFQSKSAGSTEAAASCSLCSFNLASMSASRFARLIVVTDRITGHGDIAGVVTVDFKSGAFLETVVRPFEQLRDVGAARLADDPHTCARWRDFAVGFRLVYDPLCPRLNCACLRIAAVVEIERRIAAVQEHEADAICAAVAFLQSRIGNIESGPCRRIVGAGQRIR